MWRARTWPRAGSASRSPPWLATRARSSSPESERAALLVLGHRGRGALTSAVLGSVGLACVLHAYCPVTIVRPAPVTDPAAVPALDVASPVTA